jgi:hypothetical protein
MQRGMAYSLRIKFSFGYFRQSQYLVNLNSSLKSDGDSLLVFYY